MDRLRCSTPTPPWRAMATAIRVSVTVSIAEETSGMDRVTLRLSLAVIFASLGRIAECAGSSSTSSKVRAGGANLTASVRSDSLGWLRDMLHPSESNAVLARSRPPAARDIGRSIPRCAPVSPVPGMLSPSLANPGFAYPVRNVRCARARGGYGRRPGGAAYCTGHGREDRRGLPGLPHAECPVTAPTGAVTGQLRRA